jgi:XTP/dITP diphosphohydrolase
VVEALDGAPGIRSARYAGENADDPANNQKLLEALHGLPEQQRGAHFFCAMAFVRHAADPTPLITTGRWYGSILPGPRGTGGFGYDPLFWLQEKRCSSAELSAAEKNRISHRGQALTAMVEALRAL